MAKFKKHMMYSKSGKSKMANTYEDHLELKNKGWGHSKPKKQYGGAVYNAQGMRVPGMYKTGGSTAAWQRKEGKNESGGLNEKGRRSYERENPGSDLKPPQPEGGSRKKSFCARMRGMKKKLTSKKTANDPDSRINKSLRKWKC
jgi:hypothetical protein